MAVVKDGDMERNDAPKEKAPAPEGAEARPLPQEEGVCKAAGEKWARGALERVLMAALEAKVAELQLLMRQYREPPK
jgi:hypothetical protein